MNTLPSRSPSSSVQEGKRGVSHIRGWGGLSSDTHFSPKIEEFFILIGGRIHEGFKFIFYSWLPKASLHMFERR
jgi:hypothetical protein